MQQQQTQPAREPCTGLPPRGRWSDSFRLAAAAYGACCERLCEQLGSALGLEKDVCRSAAYAALEQLPDALPELEKA